MQTRSPESLARQLEEVATQLRHVPCECGSRHTRWRGVATDVSYGLEQVRQAYNDVQANARHRVDAFDQGPHHPSSSSQSEAQPNALERGVNYRVVYAPEVLKDAPLLDTMWQSMAQGEEARVSPLVPARLLVRDDEEYLILEHDENGQIRAIRGDSPWVLSLLTATFESIWTAAAPVNPGTSELLSEEEHHIVALLSTGLTDESIARRLGVSLRTVQRKVQAIQRRLGASSRFQLGAMTAHLT